MRRLRLYHLCCCLLGVLPLVGQEHTNVLQQESAVADSADFVQVSLMVAEPSQVHIQSVFGHAFLRMQCSSADLDFCFSMESGEYEGFRDICIGNYPNRLVPVPTAHYLQSFDQEGRLVTEYPLNLTLREGKRLWQLLDETAMAGLSPYHDYFHHGCSQEIMRLLTRSLDGELVYGQRAQTYGQTIFTLGNQVLPQSSWVRMIPSMLGSTDGTDRLLADAEKTKIPSIIPDLLSDAVVVGNDGSRRPVLKPVSSVVYPPHTPQPQPSQIPLFVWFALGLLLVALLGWLSLWWRAVGRVLDAVLLLTYLAIVTLLGYVYAVSTLPTTSGWNWNFLIYNPLPLLLWLWGCVRTLPWPRLYLAYALWIGLFMMVMAGVGDHQIMEQYLLAATFAVRCLFKSVKPYINNLTNKKR